MKITMKIKSAILILGLVFFSSCTSMQRNVSITRGHTDSDNSLIEVEDLVVPLEARAGNTAGMQAEFDAARRVIRNLENNAQGDLYMLGRLSAWSGRISLAEGRVNEASRLLTQSQNSAPGNLTAMILNIRLTTNPEERLALIDRELSLINQFSPGYGELHIERGRALMELNRFAEAAGAFDIAFATEINEVYRESYVQSRNIAWEMRNTDTASVSTLSVISREGISWNDSITIALNETQLLRFISGGRNLSNTEFFNRLLERGFIPYNQDVNELDWPSTAPNQNEIVSRAGAAWFIWHLYAEARADRSMLTRYSSRFAVGPNPRSPIADIPPLSPFFDSILGCVETELLHLIDGRNFAPAEAIRGAELLAILQRIDR